MEFNKNFIVTLMILVFATAPVQVISQSGPGNRQAIRQRLMSDLQSLRTQLTKLNQTMNQLQNEISRLKSQNQRQQNRINALEKTVESLKNNDKNTQTSKPSSTNQEPARTEPEPATSKKARNQPQTNRVQDDSMWVSRPYTPYKIRRYPLDREITYLTTDDTTLTKLAHRYYRNASLWKQIYRINQDKLPSPNVVPPGVELRLPPYNELKK